MATCIIVDSWYPDFYKIVTERYVAFKYHIIINYILNQQRFSFPNANVKYLTVYLEINVTCQVSNHCCQSLNLAMR